MHHRGPDDRGEVVDRETGTTLAATRLSIIDVQCGHQPLSNEDGSVWAVLNGEIYNHAALRSELIGRGHSFTTGTDTEVLVHLYEEHGEALLDRLTGMFALALWDSRRRRLLVARDRFGEKPLFYAETRRGVAFASELDALEVLTGGPGPVDEAAVDAYFVLGYVPGTATFVDGVHQLAPGHLLTVEDGSVQVRQWWEPRRVEAPLGEDALVAALCDELPGIVGATAGADVPVGVFLSGGVDSALVTALLGVVLGGPVRSFTVGYAGAGPGELNPARTAARALGTEHHELELGDSDIASLVPSLLRGLDQPVADPALVALHAVSRFAREHVTVALGGEGADELFGGYPRYRWAGRAEGIQRVLPGSLARRAAAALHGSALGHRARRLGDVIAPLDRSSRDLLWVTNGRASERAMVFGPRLVGYSEMAWPPLIDSSLPAADGDAPTALMDCDRRRWLPGDVLAKADRASMLASLEMRAPFLSQRVDELAARLAPAEHARRPGKRVLRRVLAEVAPEVELRPKAAFEVPMAAWLHGPLAPLVGGALEEGPAVADGWFSREAVIRLKGELLARGRDPSPVLWPIIVFNAWLDERASPGASARTPRPGWRR